jgi:hypothetical protein
MSMKRAERRRTARRLAIVTRVIERNEKSVIYIQAAAFYEAAHVIAAFHWDAPSGL